MLNIKSKNISIYGHSGTWYVIDTYYDKGRYLYLLEHEEYGEDIPWLCVDNKGVIILDNIMNGIYDVIDYLA